ncbi:MAG: flagellar hook-associated protein FlgK, partial [Chromatiales bacterium]|nr:flagellar hook-associated protein FlgK [Chromatiales bacterium]
VGTQTHQAEINKAATSTLRNQAEMAMQSVSGVNLDEEAANLIKFQQAYQANAQIISIANQLFQTLLQAF